MTGGDGVGPRLSVLLPGFGFTTDSGHPAFCGVFLIEGPDAQGRPTRVLVDPAHVGRRPVLWQALADRGLTPADIDLVVLTHAHWDHVQNIDVFPSATVLLHPAERRYSLAPHVNDWATPAWTGVMLETMRLGDVQEGDEIIPGVGVLDMPGHSAGSIGITVETAEGMAVVTGDALHFAEVARTRVNPLVFWDAEQATRSIDRAVALADVLYPGHDHPFRVTRAGDVEYTRVHDLTLVGITPQTPGVHLLPSRPMPPWVMPGIEQQRSADRPSVAPGKGAGPRAEEVRGG
ncbi:MBL fold metallo-hydrolase [Geodermatophilus sp. SYSU D00697]